jgi:NAD+ synthase (glutamine-hydrolysing)
MPADVVIFSELAVCGYPPRDFLEFDDFISKCHDGILSIATECIDIAVIIGSPSVNPADQRGNRYTIRLISLLMENSGGMFHKTLLPNYDVFDEYRYFEPNRLPYNIV